ncbi:hypothetical protein FRAHR75_470002 [Frankia sp. Hr75.2]|nr:hypothetical protein FRAHR75_470002 [Frankia sp. Hr75.2]SQD99425.1 hypothetical protein FMEAI12_5290002 [Parafrankia sp. Ea1.12]
MPERPYQYREIPDRHPGSGRPRREAGRRVPKAPPRALLDRAGSPGTAARDGGPCAASVASRRWAARRPRPGRRHRAEQ